MTSGFRICLRNQRRQLDEVIKKTVPGVSEAIRWNSPMYGFKGQGWFVSFHVFTNYVKVTFFGASLRPVPSGGTGKEARWIDVPETGYDEAQLANWIRQAASIPGWSKS